MQKKSVTLKECREGGEKEERTHDPNRKTNSNMVN